MAVITHPVIGGLYFEPDEGWRTVVQTTWKGKPVTFLARFRNDFLEEFYPTQISSYQSFCKCGGIKI